MSARKSKLDQLNVAKPCSASWEQMTGNAQKRFCSECSKHVFDFSQMTRQQIEAVTAANQGNLCARIARREDGSMVMLEPPLPAYSRRRLNLPVLSAAVVAALSFGVPASAQQMVIKQGEVAAPQSNKDKQKDKTEKPGSGETSSLVGTVVDPQQAVIANVKVTLILPNSQQLTTNSSSEGSFRFTGLVTGTYTLTFEFQGFRTTVLTDVRVIPNTETPVTATMDIRFDGVTSGVVISTPATLLNLYRDSELIAIATVGNSKIAKVEEESKQLQTTLHISSVLKGDTQQRAVPLYHWLSEQDQNELKPGDRLLVFLDQRRAEDDKTIDGFETNDWSRSIKKLDDAELGIYRQRIEELNSILAVEQPNRFELVEWLVRCIEQPVTRWDGAYELEQEMNILDRVDEESVEDEKDEQLHQSVAAEILREAESAKSKDAEESNSENEASDNLYSLMTKEQKARVSHVLFSVDELTAKDWKLVNLVKAWDSKRLVPYLATQLQKMTAEAPPLTEDIVTLLAELLNDKAVQNAADEYSESLEYDVGESDSDDETSNSKAKPKSVAAQIAISKRSAKLVQFLATLNQKLHVGVHSKAAK